MQRAKQIRYAVRQLIGQGNLEVVEEVFSANYMAHAEGKTYTGYEFIKRFSRQLRESIPDLTVLEVGILLEGEDTVAWQRTLQGTHRAGLMGIPPSGKMVKWNEMVVSRFEGNKIAEEWVVSELACQLLLKLPGKK